MGGGSAALWCSTSSVRSSSRIADVPPEARSTASINASPSSAGLWAFIDAASKAGRPPPAALRPGAWASINASVYATMRSPGFSDTAN